MFSNIGRSAIVFVILICSFNLYAQQDKEDESGRGGVPPAKVVVAQVKSGMITSESKFIGTVYYREVSEVASETDGKIEEVSFEVGQRVQMNETLVRLNTDLLTKSLKAAKATYEQTIEDLTKAKRDLDRAKKLFAEKLVSEQTYDDRRFAAASLEKKAESLKAGVEQLETELEKTSIVAPFDGIILEKHVDRGEWLNAGSVVGVLGNDTFVDIIAEVPSTVIRYIKEGRESQITVNERQLTGKIVAVIPKGNISTRTFPVKVRARNTLSLAEGMEALVNLPTGDREKALIVPRDAVIKLFGNNVAFAIVEETAVMIPVTIVGFDGLNVGVRAERLKEGMNVVIKGNERLRDGQPVIIQ